MNDWIIISADKCTAKNSGIDPCKRIFGFLKYIAQVFEGKFKERGIGLIYTVSFVVLKMEIYSHSNDAAWQEILFIVSKHYVPLKVNVYFSCRTESTRPLRDRDKARWMKMKFFYIYILNTVGGVTLVIACLSILKLWTRIPIAFNVFFSSFLFRKPSTSAPSVTRLS